MSNISCRCNSAARFNVDGLLPVHYLGAKLCVRARARVSCARACAHCEATEGEGRGGTHPPCNDCHIKYLKYYMAK